MSIFVRGAACEGPHERTCGREERAFAGAKLRPAAAFSRPKFRIQNSRFKITKSERSLCGGRARLQGVAGLRCPQAAARTVLTDRPMTSIPHGASPQSSGWACDHKEQPSARGRLRAADRCAIEFAGRHFDQNCGCGLRRHQRSRKFSIQDSRFKIKWACRGCLGIRSDAGCSLRRATRSGPAGRELRVSAPGRLRPARSYRTETALRPAIPA